MLKSHFHKLAVIAALALVLIGSPAMAMSAAEAEAFEAEIGEAKSKMMGHSASALEHARKARLIAAGETTKANKARLTARWLEAEALMRLNQATDAVGIIEEAVAETERSFAGSKLHADLLRSQASLNARKGAFATALPIFKQAQEIYGELGEDRSRAIVLQNIGSLYSGARLFEKALSYYQMAGEAYPGDPALALSAHNNTGNALKGLGRYQEAEIAFVLALESAKPKNSPLLEARILTNIASAQVMGGKLDKAERTAAKAMDLAKQHAPEWARFVHGVMAQVALSRENWTSAEAHLARAFEGLDLTATAAHFREFHETAVRLFGQTDEAGTARLHRAAIERLDAQVAKLETI